MKKIKFNSKIGPQVFKDKDFLNCQRNLRDDWNSGSKDPIGKMSCSKIMQLTTDKNEDVEVSSQSGEGGQGQADFFPSSQLPMKNIWRAVAVKILKSTQWLNIFFVSNYAAPSTLEHGANVLFVKKIIKSNDPEVQEANSKAEAAEAFALIKIHHERSWNYINTTRLDSYTCILELVANGILRDSLNLWRIQKVWLTPDESKFSLHWSANNNLVQ